MSDLGLDALTDDQLVELAREITRELCSRNPDVLDAATVAIREETERAKSSQDDQWARKKWLASMATRGIGAGWRINVWRAGNRDETRVYFENARESLKYCLYVTGNSRQPPGSMTVEGNRRAERPAARLVEMICTEAHRCYPQGVAIDCDTAAATAYEVPGLPAEIEQLIAPIEAARRAEEVAKRRKEIEREAERRAYAEYREALAAAIGAARGELVSPHVRTDYLEGQAGAEVVATLSALKASADAQMAAELAAYDAEHGAPA